MARAHGDLATFLAELVVSLFDIDQLTGLQGALEPYRGLADAALVRRALLSQMCYVADVAASMPRNVYATAGGLFRLSWRRSKTQALAVACVPSVSFSPGR